MVAVERRFGRWQQVLVNALVDHDAVGLRAVVEDHLGRDATRAEITAARRAAHSLEQGGRARVARFAVPTAQGGGTVLMVFRPELSPPSTLTATMAEAAGRSEHRLGRWQQVIVDALADRDAVGLRAVVEGHLGRRATRAEITAGRRAAHLLERGGRVRVERVKVPTPKGRKGAILLVVVRPDLAPADVPDEATLRLIATQYVAPADRTQEALATIASNLQAVAASIEEVQIYTVEAEQAQQAAPRWRFPYTGWPSCGSRLSSGAPDPNPRQVPSSFACRRSASALEQNFEKLVRMKR
jgi:hypothetical protein